MDTYTAVLSVVFLAFCEVVAVCWIFGKMAAVFCVCVQCLITWSLTDFLFPKGVRKISLMVKRMLDNVPSIYFRFCWILLCPLLILVRFRVSNYSSALVFQLCVNLSKWQEYSSVVYTLIQHCSLRSCSLRKLHLPSVGWLCWLVYLIGLHCVDPTWCHSWDVQKQRFRSSSE